MAKKKTQPKEKPETPETETPETANSEPETETPETANSEPETETPETETQKPGLEAGKFPMVQPEEFAERIKGFFAKRLDGRLQWQRHEAKSELNKAINDALRQLL